MNYNDAIKYIDDLKSLGSRPGTDAIKDLLRRLDNPQDKLNVIHIGGTNGKGSVGAYLDFGYREYGLKVGRYISPTLFSYLERFQINGNQMSEDEFCDVLSLVKEKCDEIVSEGLIQPTAFEIETAVSFIYFLKNNVDLVLLEVGMGGEEDATNVVSKPLATVFATISYDHMQFLGNTIEEISKTKAGIMRKGVAAIASRMPFKCATDTLRNCADEIGAEFFSVEDESDFSKNIKRINNDVFFNDIKINNPLLGEFQKINLETALFVFTVLNRNIQNNGFENSGLVKIRNTVEEKGYEVFIKGIEKTKWPGRFEIISINPTIIRDGAHNEDAVRLLKKTIEDYLVNNNSEAIDCDKKVHLIMGVFKDKDYKEMLKIILPVAKSFSAITPPNLSRALLAKDLCECAKKIYDDDIVSNKEENIKFSYHENLKEAIDSVNAGKDEVIIVFGSLSLSCLFGR